VAGLFKLIASFGYKMMVLDILFQVYDTPEAVEGFIMTTAHAQTDVWLFLA
jgi:hypothetical protein